MAAQTNKNMPDLVAARTYQALGRDLCGHAVTLDERSAVITIQTTEHAAADSRVLVHGGFTFCLADHAAMLAVNQHNVVLGDAKTGFTRPVRAGDSLIAWAKRRRVKGEKRVVDGEVRRDDALVMREASFHFYPKQYGLTFPSEAEA